jgi:tetratricopeptide (TPR) repeat protein
MDAILDHAASLTARAIALAAEGRLEEAEANFRAVVRLRPDDAAAHNHLGAVLAALGRTDEAIAAYAQALRLRPELAAAHANRAELLRQQGRFTEALDAFGQASRLQGDSPETHFGLAGTLRSLGRHAEAAAHYRQTLALRPGTVEAMTALAAVLVEEGQREEALAMGRQALGLLNRAAAATCFELGTVFLRVRAFDEAIAAYRHALRSRPDDPDTLNNLGTAFWELGQLEQAETHYRRAHALRGGEAETVNLGNALREQGRLEEAAACYREALARRGDLPETLSNLGVVLSSLGALDEAETALRRALSLRPEWAVAHDNLATVWLCQGKLDAALEGYEDALRHDSGYAEARRNRAMAWLLKGDCVQGWPEYEWRLKCRGVPAVDYPQPRWQGEHLAGRTILLHAEQGLGDTLQFVRYAPLVKRRGGTVLLVCPAPLVALLERTPGIDRVLAAGSPLPPFDVHAPLLSLPLILATRSLAEIPAEVPYLFAAPEAIARWRRTLAAQRGFRVGVAWQGNPRYPLDRQRSFPLVALEPLARVEGVRLISLQKGAGAEQCPALGGRFPIAVLEGWEDGRAGDFPDTAAVVRNLDLVVSPSSALAHLAGGLGARVWVALPTMPDWRWLTDRDDSPWYPRVRLFRQLRPGDWTDVFARMASALEQEARSTPA